MGQHSHGSSVDCKYNYHQLNFYKVGPPLRNRQVGANKSWFSLSFMLFVTIVNGIYKPTFISLGGLWLRLLSELRVKQKLYVFSLAGELEATFEHIIVTSPLQFGGGCWTPRFCRGPQRQVPCGHSTKSISALQGRDLPSTKSRTFHSPHIWPKKSCFLQNQGPHMWRHQNKSKNITCWVKTSNDDSVEICVRVDSVEIFCWSLIL